MTAPNGKSGRRAALLNQSGWLPAVLLFFFGESWITALLVFLLWTLTRLVWKGLRALHLRYWHFLNPLAVAICGWLAASLAHSWVPAGWWVPFTLTLAPALLVGLAPEQLPEGLHNQLIRLVPTWLDTGKTEKIDAPPERIYLALLLALAGGWTACWQAIGHTEWLDWTWWVLLAGFGGPWGWTHRLTKAGKAHRYAIIWQRRIASDKGTIPCLRKSKVVRLIGGKAPGLVIRLAGTVKAEDVVEYSDNIGALYRIRPGGVMVVRDDTDSGRCIVTFLKTSPFAKEILHPFVLEPRPAKIAELGPHGEGKRLPIGMYANGATQWMKLWHTFIVGASGGGKSVFIHNLMITLTSCIDVAVVAADLGGGSTLAPWRKLLAAPLADDVPTTSSLIRRVLAVTAEREQRLGISFDDDDEDEDDARDTFEPTADEPWLVLFIDEYPDWVSGTSKDDLKALGRLAKRARKCGVWIILAAQNGSKVDVGSKEIQAQLKCMIGLTLDDHASGVAWGTLRKQGWDSAVLRAGQHLLRDDEHQRPDIAQGWYVSVEHRKAHMAQATRTVLNPSAQAALLTGSIVRAEPRKPPDPNAARESFLGY